VGETEETGDDQGCEFERLGFPTRNYYLGWSDWGNAEDTPVETGAAAKPGQP